MMQQWKCGQGIRDVDKFVYLGVTVSKEGGGTQGIHNREVTARGVFMRLRMIWSSTVKPVSSGHPWDIH